MTKLHKGVASNGLLRFLKMSNLHYIKYFTFPTTVYFSNSNTVYFKRDYQQIPNFTLPPTFLHQMIHNPAYISHIHRAHNHG